MGAGAARNWKQQNQCAHIFRKRSRDAFAAFFVCLDELGCVTSDDHSMTAAGSDGQNSDRPAPAPETPVLPELYFSCYCTVC